jgi:hypothetical protein
LLVCFGNDDVKGPDFGGMPGILMEILKMIVDVFMVFRLNQAVIDKEVDI